MLMWASEWLIAFGLLSVTPPTPFSGSFFFCDLVLSFCGKGWHPTSSIWPFDPNQRHKEIRRLASRNNYGNMKRIRNIHWIFKDKRDSLVICYLTIIIFGLHTFIRVLPFKDNWGYQLWIIGYTKKSKTIRWFSYFIGTLNPNPFCVAAKNHQSIDQRVSYNDQPTSVSLTYGIAIL